MHPGNLFPLIALYLMAVNTLTYAMFFWDKRQAMLHLWRVREDTLLLLTLAGGSSAAKLAQRLFRHKTRKQPFASRLNAIVCLHLLLCLALAFPPARHGIVRAAGWSFNVIATPRSRPAPAAAAPRQRDLPRRFGPGSADWQR